MRGEICAEVPVPHKIEEVQGMVLCYGGLSVCQSLWQNAIYLGHSWKVPPEASGTRAPHFAAAAAASGGMRNAGMEWNGFRGSYIHDIRRLYERVPSGRASG